MSKNSCKTVEKDSKMLRRTISYVHLMILRTVAAAPAAASKNKTSDTNKVWLCLLTQYNNIGRSALQITPFLHPPPKKKKKKIKCLILEA